MNIGVLGGTFDPVHRGHLAIAAEARARLNLAEIIFVPSGQPWQKAGSIIAPAEHRLQMLRLAIAGEPDFKVATLEMERPGPTYTIDTILVLRGQLDSEDELFFILGWDSLAGLPEWHDPRGLIKLCYLVAAPRPGCPRPDLKAMEEIIPGLSQRVMLMDKPEVDISASAIRDRVARGLPVHHLVTGPVNRYIRQHNLYRN